MDKPDIIVSVVIPVYNSAETLHALNDRLVSVMEDLVGPQYEIIFVNDGSKDSSWDRLKQIASENEKIIAINLTRNFGQHNAIMCGFSQARGIYVVTIDDDLQIPPEEIPKIFEKIESGYDVVYGVYEQKQHTAFRNLSSKLVQYAYRRTFNLNLAITSFRIIRREIVQFIRSYEKSFTYIDGLLAWFTQNIGNVTVKHQKRKVAKSGYSLTNLMMLALNMMTNFSIVPL
ncbi:MAG: glycosyltransferase family 2 protein, partial [Deltaproteobacteria bacterium]|nr:glycosyltransferase family 2 protein [Deltaproteobacteria bacterium]